MATLNPESLEAIHRLWDALADIAPDRIESALECLLRLQPRDASIIHASWAGAVRLTRGERATSQDPMRRWRVAAAHALHGYVPPPHRIWDRPDSDPSFDLPLRELGRFRSYSFRRQLPSSWFRSVFYRQHYGDYGIKDAAFVAFPVNADCESHFGFYADRRLSARDIAGLTYALRGIKWLHRNLMLGHGLMLASAPLTPTERKVVNLLLTEFTEKQIAAKLQLAVSTVHQHVQSVFRKFGIRNRAGLMRLWLGGSSS